MINLEGIKIMKINKIALVVGAFLCSSVMAVERVEHTVTVTAQIPTDNFYVQPVGDWINTPQQLVYNVYTKELSPVSRQFDIKSTLGPVQAFLSSPASIASGANTIPLSVSVAGKVLNTTPVEVLNTADALTGKVVSLDILAANAPVGGYVPGTYQGVVHMMFESEAPAVPPTP